MPQITEAKDSFAKSKLVAGFKSRAVAHYDPRSQIITLNNYDKKRVEAIKQADDATQKEFAATIIHEFTHWIDHVSSLWGLNNLSNWLSGFAAYRSNEEGRFPAVLTARHALKAMKYSSYFTRIDIANADEARKKRPWKYQYTVGLTFDAHGNLNQNHPILFTTFTTSDDRSIGRVPMSAGALLELNAVAVDAFFDLLRVVEAGESGDLVEKGVREQLIKKKYDELIYSPELLEYAVAAHCFGSSVKESGIIDAFRLGARLSEVAMNLPSTYFERIRMPEQMKHAEARHPYFLRRQSVGYAYWCLCQHASSATGDADQRTEEALGRAGLPDRTTIATATIAEMEKLVGKIQDQPVADHFNELAMYGISVFRKHQLSRIVNMYEIYDEAEKSGMLPFICFGDGNLIAVNRSWRTLTQDNLEDWCNAIWRFDSWSESFQDACLP